MYYLQGLKSGDCSMISSGMPEVEILAIAREFPEAPPFDDINAAGRITCCKHFGNQWHFCPRSLSHWTHTTNSRNCAPSRPASSRHRQSSIHNTAPCRQRTPTRDKMRTYDDSFSGQRIYPGKVRLPSHVVTPSSRRRLRPRAMKCLIGRLFRWGEEGQCFHLDLMLTEYS
jgi:hypothetical protein